MSEDLAPIATEVIYEDEYVRVWNQVVGAGEAIPRHRHDNDYYLVNVKGTGPIHVEFHDDTGGTLGAETTFSPQPRRADFVPRGHVETARNEGGEYRAILIEFKGDKRD